MRVSVLIPVYNREQLLGEAIESVLNQTYQDFELIVVDDGSTDGTSALAGRYERVRYVRQEHSGVPAARNRALKEARGEMIAWLDSDDLYLPTKLEKQVAYLDAHPECQIVFCRRQNFTDIKEEELTARQLQLIRMNERSDISCLPTTCIRRELFEQWGDFNEKYPYNENIEWMTRVHAGGIDLNHCVNESLYKRRIHPGEITFTHERTENKGYLALVADAIRNARKGRKLHDKD